MSLRHRLWVPLLRLLWWRGSSLLLLLGVPAWGTCGRVLLLLGRGTALLLWGLLLLLLWRRTGGRGSGSAVA